MDPTWVAPVALAFVFAFIVCIGAVYYYADRWFGGD